MAFQYGCFISFRHLDKLEPFVRQLSKDIKNELDLYGNQLDVFLDENRIKPGDHFNMLIPQALCRSVVLVVIYVPAYFHADKPYCTKEFVAFVEHEKRRLLEIQQKKPDADVSSIHQVIPIIMRKDASRPLPEELVKDRNRIDWSDNMAALANPSKFSKSTKYQEDVRMICEKIWKVYESASNLQTLVDCPKITALPDDDHALIQKLLTTNKQRFPQW